MCCLDPGVNLLEERLAFLQTQNVTIALAQAFLAGLGVDRKKLIHLRHDPNRGLISGIEFDCIKELSPGMRPPRGMNHLFSTHLLISAVTGAFGDSRKAAQ